MLVRCSASLTTLLSDPNPHLGHLAWADAFVITADSTSMLSEACSTGYAVNSLFSCNATYGVHALNHVFFFKCTLNHVIGSLFMTSFESQLFETGNLFMLSGRNIVIGGFQIFTRLCGSEGLPALSLGWKM